MTEVHRAAERDDALAADTRLRLVVARLLRTPFLAVVAAAVVVTALARAVG